MKKIIGLAMASVVLLTALAGCSSKSDWAYIESKKQLNIGMTLFSPMNYKDESGELVGFETEFATAVCEELGVKANFQEIDWNSKETELNSKNVDCLWNGFTINDERRTNMDISTSYMQNKQIMVVKAENVTKFNTPEAMKDAKVVAEASSAGETVATTDDYFKEAKFTAVDSQAKALMEVKSGTSDIAVIDYVMTIGSIGDNTDYADLVAINDKGFAPEEYGIAFRKGSPETLKKINAAIQTTVDSGKLEEIAAKYKLQDLLIFVKS